MKQKSTPQQNQCSSLTRHILSPTVRTKFATKHLCKCTPPPPQIFRLDPYIIAFRGDCNRFYVKITNHQIDYEIGNHEIVSLHIS